MFGPDQLHSLWLLLFWGFFFALCELSRKQKRVPITTKYSCNCSTKNTSDVPFKANPSKQDTVNKTREKQEVK